MGLIKKNWVWILAAVMAAFLILPAIFLHSFSYSEVLTMMIKWTGKPDKLEKLKTVYLPESRFNQIQILASLLPLGILPLIVFFYQNRKSLHVFEQNLFKNVGLVLQWIPQNIKLLSAEQKKLLFLWLILISVIRMILVFVVPFTYDESYVWLEMVNKGPLVSAFYYPIHGNHLFQTVYSSFLHFIYPEPWFSMRLMSVIFSGMAGLLWFLWVYHKHGVSAAWLSLWFLDLSYVNGLHSFMGRGYIPGLFFAILILIIWDVWVRRAIFFFGVFFACIAVLGIWTLPSFIFWVAPLLLAWAWYHKQEWQQIPVVLFIIAVGTVLWYGPVYLLNQSVLLQTAYYQSNETVFLRLQRLWLECFQIPLWLFSSWQLPVFFLLLMAGIQKMRALHPALSTVFFLYIALITFIGMYSQVWVPGKGFLPVSLLMGLGFYYVIHEMIPPNPLNSAFFLITATLFAGYREFNEQFGSQLEASAFAQDFWKNRSKAHWYFELNPENESDMFHVFIKMEGRNKELIIEKQADAAQFILAPTCSGEVLWKQKDWSICQKK